jgi:hypothetical protein
MKEIDDGGGQVEYGMVVGDCFWGCVCFYECQSDNNDARFGGGAPNAVEHLANNHHAEQQQQPSSVDPIVAKLSENKEREREKAKQRRMRAHRHTDHLMLHIRIR